MSQQSFLKTAPVLACDNLTVTLAFYRDVLGFEVAYTFGKPAYYAVVRRDNAAEIHFSEREDTSSPIAPATVYVFVTSADAVYEEYTAKGIDVFTPPEVQEWGTREFEVSDLNGHFLIIGEVGE